MTVYPPYVDPDQLPPALESLGRVHIVGIGGSGMSAIARLLLAAGIPVSGSDAVATDHAQGLTGARIEIGHDPAHVRDADTVVVSTAIRESNPEVVEARRRGLPVLHRSLALASVAAGRRVVAVAGAHGKTSTTSMLATTLQYCGADPSYAIGAELADTGSNARLGGGDIFVAEADESDGSFLLLWPAGAIITNIEADHLDRHGDLDGIRSAYRSFVDTVEPGGFLVLCADDRDTLALRADALARGLRVRTYGEGPADLRLSGLFLEDGATSYDAELDGSPLGRVRVGALGVHMALNSAAVLLTGLELGFAPEQLTTGLERYAGVHRRFELTGTADGVRVYDDYAHHPTEIAAQLRAARSVAQPGRLVAVFQPYLYTRTQTFAAEFGAALGLADEAVVMEIAVNREDPIPGVTGRLIAERVPLPAERVAYAPTWSGTAQAVVERAGPGDVIVLLGSGPVYKLAPEILELLAERAR
ncbi:MAG: UDP-N-acetylmuramate--L-alanine ligase [Geodermatophilaceae bacterium]|nr:UDP-N-acetylmuramate--L-alanine ligase [Geodermatophilaceae bacterium]